MQKLTIEQTEKKLKADPDTRYTSIRKYGKETFNVCWILPDGYLIDCSSTDHELVTDVVGLSMQQAFESGWVRKAALGEYHFLRNDLSIKLVEEDILKDINKMELRYKYVMDIETNSKRLSAWKPSYSYTFSKAEFIDNEFKLRDMLARKFQIYPVIKPKDDACTLNF